MMSHSDETESTAQSAAEGPQAALEKRLIEQFLRSKGYTFKELCNLPEDEAKALMIEACQYASLKLAIVESTAHFREKIREPS
jgi:hypothetical protein